MPRKKKFKYEDAIKYLIEKFEGYEGSQRLGENYFFVNGWRVKFNSRGIYWHSRLVSEFKFILSENEYEIRSDKPFTKKSNIDRNLIEKAVSNILTTKTERLKKREQKERKRRERIEARRLKKRIFCYQRDQLTKIECPFGTHKNKCDHMKNFSESYGIYSCNNPEWWEWNWCTNAKRVFDDKKKVFLGHFVCKLTGEKCPYNSPSVVKGEYVLKTNVFGEHFTDCPSYEGIRKKPGFVSVENIQRVA